MTSTSYPASASDWRGVFIRNIAQALASHPGIALSLWCPPGEYPPNSTSAASESDTRWLARLSGSGGMAHALRGRRISAACAAAQLLWRLRALYRRSGDQDVIHANWLQLALPLASDRKPVLVTVLGTDFQLLALPGMVPLLRRALKGRPAAICPNADWMVPRLVELFGDIAMVRCVPFGIDPAYFELERMPAQPPRWLCVTRVTKEKVGDLFSWGETCFRNTGRQLHLLGPMQGAVSIPDWVHYHGPVSQHDLVSSWFPSAAGLISLSNHPEGRPQVMVEALASGIPVVASDLPAHLDLLEETGCGLICRSASELQDCLARAEDAEFARTLSDKARRWAWEEYGSWQSCASRYVSIYEQLLAQ